MEHAEDWPKSVAKQVGERIAYFRERARDSRGRKLTAQALADKCTELGLQIGRPAIAKMERGLRDTITVQELEVIARALNVSPADLMFPLGQRETVELMPGYHVDTWAAVLWFSGFAARPGRPPPTLENSVIPLYQVHHRVLEDVAVANHEHRQTATTLLRQIRRDMRERGLVPPELPRYMARYDVDNGEAAG